MGRGQADPAGYRKKKGTVGRKVLERGRLGPQIANLVGIRGLDLVRELDLETVIRRYGCILFMSQNACMINRNRILKHAEFNCGALNIDLYLFAKTVC